MTKLVVSICPINGMRKPGVVLEKTDSIREKIIEVMRPSGIPKEVIKKDKEDKIMILAEDWELVSKFLNLDKINISTEKAAYYFGKGEPRIVPYAENKINIGFALPNEREFGVYELAFSFSIYQDLGMSDQVWYKISDAFVIYHFPKNKLMDYQRYKEIGIEKCYFNKSAVTQYDREIDWPILPLCTFGNLKNTDNTDEDLKLSLERCIEEGWKDFFTIATKVYEKEAERNKIYKRLEVSPA